MNWCRLFGFSILFLNLLVIPGICFTDEDSAKPSHTLQDLISFVDNATTFAEEKGSDIAFVEFNNKNGRFMQDDLYLYVYDYDGIVLAHPVNPELIGVNRLMEKDAIGTFFIQNLRQAALNNTGFARYTYINPSKGNRIEEKLGYVRMVNENYWLGSGLYGGPVESLDSNTTFSVLMQKIPGLVSYIQTGVEYIHREGKEKSLLEFSDKNGSFTIKNQYIAAYDLNGTCLTHPNFPDTAGQNTQNHSSIDEEYSVEAMIEIVENRNQGFLSYSSKDPLSKSSMQKLSFVKKIDDWFIISGIYF